MVDFKIQLLATDLDGTFSLYGDHVPKSSFATIAKMKQSNKFPVAICSGRGWAGAKIFLKNKVFDFLIGGDGSLVVDLKNNKQIYKNFISVNDAQKLVELANQLDLLWASEYNEYVIFKNDERMSDHPYVKYASYKFKFLDQIDQDVPKFLFLTSRDKIDQLHKKLLSLIDQSKYKVYKMYKSCEVIKRENSKWEGLKKVANYLKLDPKFFVGIGDSANDFEFLSNVGYSIAMGNASPEIKEISDYVTDDVEKDGWAKAMQHIGAIDEY